MKLFQKIVPAVLCLSLLCFSPSVQAASSSSLPQQVVSELGFLSGVTLSEPVTRAQFAQILLNASSYQGNAGTTVAYNLFQDVSADASYAPAIYTAVQEGWMTGYLGGSFRPDQAITLREAVNGVIALLGYTDSDFSGNQTQGRVSLYYSKKLNEDITTDLNNSLAQSDCVQLLYNLMKADTKQGSLYGQLFDCTLDSDGEIDYLSLLSVHSNSVKGPIKVEKELEKILPFDPDKGTFFIDGENTEDYSSITDGDMLYYSSRTKTVWVYHNNVSSGVVTGIGYDLTGSLTPTAVYVDTVPYLLDSSEIKLDFANSSKVRIGDEITVIFDVSEDANGDSTYSLVDFQLD